MKKERYSLKHIVYMFFIWLIITQGFSWLAFNRIRITEADKKEYSYTLATPVFKPHPLNFLEMHARWDSAWYFSIVYEGYSFTKKGQSNVNFFPLYPIAMKVGYEILKPFTSSLTLYHSYVLSGTFISILSLFLSTLFLYKLFRLDVDSKTSLLGIFFLLVFPTSYVLTSLYAESLFLLFSVLTFYFARKRQFVLSGISGFLAALSRPIGILLILPVAIELIIYLKKEKEIDNLERFSILLIPLGLITYMIYLNQKFSTPLAFMESTKTWGRVFNADILTFINRELNFNHASAANMLLELGLLIFGILVSILVLKKERLSYGIWSIVLILIPLASGILVSQPRYTMVVFPLFLTIARISKQNFLFLVYYLMISILLLGLFTVLFVNGHWSF